MTRLPTSTNDQAAYWFLRLQDADVTPEEIEQALTWQDESAEHRAAFARVERFWQEAEGRTTTAAAPSAETSAIRRWLRVPNDLGQAAARIAAVLVIAIMSAVGTLLSTGAWQEPVEPVRYATAVGETRRVALPDGSDLLLGAASAVSVQYADDVRRIILTDGEALFTVAKDAERPFIVEAAAGQVQAIGTVFNVHRGLQGVTVAVVEGAVQVRPKATEPASAVRLSSGYQATYTAVGRLGEVAAVDPSHVTSWERGKLTFIDRPLGAVVADLNRYSPRPITIEGDRLKDVRLTAVLAVDGVDDWVRALERTLVVKVTQTERGIILTPKALSSAAPRRK